MLTAQENSQNQEVASGVTYLREQIAQAVPTSGFKNITKPKLSLRKHEILCTLDLTSKFYLETIKKQPQNCHKFITPRFSLYRL